LSQTPGPIAARQYNCGTQTVTPASGVSFFDSGIGFGTTLPTPPGTFTNFLLRPGIYQVHLSISSVQTTGQGTLTFGFGPFGSILANWLIPSSGPLGGDRLFSVTTANQSVALGLFGGLGGNTAIINAPINSPCLLILTQLH
jgi:hypothetical protein